MTMNMTDEYLSLLLRKQGISPTSQRIAIARVIFARMTHLSADDVYRHVNEHDKTVSKATVYNTLGLLARKGVIREVIADPDRVFYDPNTLPHHHFYNADTGQLTDINASQVIVSGLPVPPNGTEVVGVEVVVRVRSAP
jgi:Fur family iron response transcriptional regulator